MTIDLLSETEGWSRGEFDAWNATDAGLTLYEFGPRGEKRLGAWTENEFASLKLQLEGTRSSNAITVEIWGLISLNVYGQQRTGAQCRSMALLQHNTINWAREEFTLEWLALHRIRAMDCRETLRNNFADTLLSASFAPWREIRIYPWSNEPQEATSSTFIVGSIVEEYEDNSLSVLEQQQQPFEEVEVMEENTNMTIASTGSAATMTRKKLVMSSDSEEEIEDNSRISVQTVSTIGSQHNDQLPLQMAPQDLYDFVVTSITRRYLDTSELLQKKFQDLVLENRAYDLEKQVSKFLSDLRNKYVIRETDNFLNGFDSQEANPDRPTHMRKAYFNKLRSKNPKESKTLVKAFVDKAQKLFDQVIKVKVVDIEEEDTEEEDDEEDGEAYHSRKEHTAKRQRQSDTVKKRWTAQPAADRDGEAIDVSRKRSAHAAPPHHSSSIKHQLGLDVREENATSGHRQGKVVGSSNLERRAVRRDADYNTHIRDDDNNDAFYQDSTFGDETTEHTATKKTQGPRKKFVAGSSRKCLTSQRSNAPPTDDQHHDDARYGRFLYRATETGFMKLPSNAELPSNYEHANTVNKPLLVHPPLRFFQNKQPPTTTTSLAAAPTSLTLISSTPDDLLVLTPSLQQPQSTSILQRCTPQFKNLNDLADDFLSSSNGDLNAWGDLLEAWARTCSTTKADFDSLVRPVVEHVSGLPSSKKRCFILKSLCQVAHCDRAIRIALIFLITYDYLESIYLVGEEESNDQEMIDFLMEWDCKAWVVINSALEVLKVGRTRHNISTLLLQEWEISNNNALPDFDKIAAMLLRPVGAGTKRKSTLQWFEFCWEMIWRFFPLIGGDEQSNNWAWITKSLLPSLPCWFHSAITEKDQFKWTRTLRSLWHENALPRDYILLIINRVIELNEHWKPCCWLTPVLFTACCKTNCEDISALIKLLQVELAKSPLFHSRIIDILNAATQRKSGFEFQACQLLVALMVFCSNSSDAKSKTQLSRIMNKFCELAPISNASTTRLIGEILPLACEHGLLSPQCKLVKVMDNLVDVEASLKSCWALAMHLENQRGKLGNWQFTMVQLGRKIAAATSPYAFLVFVDKVAREFVASQPLLCFDHKVDNGQEDEDAWYGKEMALFEAKKQTLMTEEMLDLVVTTLPQLAQNCLLNGIYVQETQRVLEFSSWMVVVLGVKGHNVKPLLDVMQTWPYLERNELMQPFDRFYFGVVNASNQLGLARPQGYV